MPAVAVPDALIAAAVGGDQGALERLLRTVSDDVYRLAHRMLWHPQIAMRLRTFRGDAKVTTWMHRIAVNHLLTERRQRLRAPVLSFTEFGADLAHRLNEPYDARGVDEGLLAEEVKVGCTQAMLLCLDPEHRMAYVLGDVLDYPRGEAAELCAVSPAAFRKRLERARHRIQEFMAGHCGLIDATNPCRCRRRIGAAMSQGRVDPGALLFAPRVRALQSDMERFHDAAGLFRSHPELRASPQIVQAVLRAVA